MSKKINYEENPFGKNIKIGEPIENFFPSPEELCRKEETIKVTITLTKSSVDFFKKYSKSKHKPYQTMIRNLLEQYTSHFNKNA